MKAISTADQNSDRLPPLTIVTALAYAESPPRVSESISFDEVYETHAAFVWRTVRRLGVREADVSDVCQEIFLVVHRKLSGFAARSSLRTWIYGIALRCASTHRRLAHVVRESPEEKVELDQQFQPDGRATRAQMDRLLDRLDQDKREVFVLYELEELPMSEIATIVGCPLQTAYSRLHAAHKILTAAANGQVQS